MTRHHRSTSPGSGFAVAYCRVSTDEQKDSGLGLDAQATSIQSAAKRLHLGLRGSFTDAGLSGALPIDKRPQLAAALATLRRGDVLLVAKRDRIARDVLTAAMIEAAARRKGARIVSAAGEGTETDDPTAHLMRTMIDAFAAYERLVIGARTSAALRAKAARGERYGELPYGFRIGADGKTLEEQPRERALLDAMARCRIGASMTWRAMASALNEQGYTTRRGTPWTLHVARSAFLTWQRNTADQCAHGSK